MEQEFSTNTRACSIQRQNVSCDDLWSLGQQEAIRRLSVLKKGWFDSEAHYELISKFSERAKKIAGVYARFYLEQEDGCNPDKEGRFYWMGLAAFASKQVMCALQFAENKAFTINLYMGGVVGGAAEISRINLGKGNFWLFQDIFVWHWFYANHKDCYELCFNARDVENYSSSQDFDVKSNVESLPWASEALSVLNGLKVTENLEQGFSLIDELDSGEVSGRQKKEVQLNSLMKVAQHEQIDILQPLIYEGWFFRRVLDAQKEGEWLDVFEVMPRRTAVFAEACELPEENGEGQLQVRMRPEDDLYDKVDRMKYIADIALQYHSLMQGDRSVESKQYMKEMIAGIAQW